MKLLNFKWKFVWGNQRFSFFVARVLKPAVMSCYFTLRDDSATRNEAVVIEAKSGVCF